MKYLYKAVTETKHRIMPTISFHSAIATVDRVKQAITPLLVASTQQQQLQLQQHPTGCCTHDLSHGRSRHRAADEGEGPSQQQVLAQSTRPLSNTCVPCGSWCRPSQPADNCRRRRCRRLAVRVGGPGRPPSKSQAGSHGRTTSSSL